MFIYLNILVHYTILCLIFLMDTGDWQAVKDSWKLGNAKKNKKIKIKGYPPIWLESGN